MTPDSDANSFRSALRSWLVIGLHIVVPLLLVFVAAAFVSCVRTGGNQRENATLLKMQKVEQAYKSYYTLNDVWPDSPEVLTERSPDGRPPLLDGGPAAIASAWGTPFTVEIQSD